MDSWRPCILIPVFNHEHAIVQVVEGALEFDTDIILIDDGSDNSCGKVLQSLSNRYELVSLIQMPENQGKGEAVKKGFLEAEKRSYSHALQIDADGQHTISDIQKFLDLGFENQRAVICGCPIYGDDIPKIRLYGRYLTHVWVYINTWSLKIKDSMCGFRLYPLAETCNLVRQETVGSRMDFDTEIIVRWVWRGGKVINLFTKVNYPLDGVSHFNALADNWRITKMHTRLFFGMLFRLPKILHRKFRSQEGIDLSGRGTSSKRGNGDP